MADTIPTRLQELLARELAPGERIVWQGHPRPLARDRRAILIEVPLRRATIQSFAGERLAGVIRHESPSGEGDLIFEREASKGRKGRTVYRDVGFFALHDARAVQQLLPVHQALS